MNTLWLIYLCDLTKSEGSFTLICVTGYAHRVVNIVSTLICRKSGAYNGISGTEGARQFRERARTIGADCESYNSFLDLIYIKEIRDGEIFLPENTDEERTP